jgi:hypothetical protein
LVLLEQSRSTLLPRLSAELASSGFGVAVATPSAFPPSRQEMEQLARQEHTELGLVMMEAGAGVELWVLDPSTGKSTFREVILSLYDPHDAPEVIALRVMETFRATLLDLEHAPPRPPEPEPKAVVQVEPAATPKPERFTLALGGGGAYSSGGVGAAAHLDASLAWAANPHFSLVVDALLTPAATKLHGPEGEATVSLYMAGFSLRFHATGPGSLVRFRSGAGVWLAVMNLGGQAAATYVNTPSQFVSAIPHLDLGLRLGVTDRLGLALGASGGVSAPGASIRFANRQVATWGRPLWLATLALEVPLD